jgi:hypothetical protein
VRFALLRRPAWLDGRRVRVARADLVRGRYDEGIVDTAAVEDSLEAWLAERMVVIRERVAEARPSLGLDCARCAFIAACPLLRGRP